LTKTDINSFFENAYVNAMTSSAINEDSGQLEKLVDASQKTANWGKLLFGTLYKTPLSHNITNIQIFDWQDRNQMSLSWLVLRTELKSAFEALITSSNSEDVYMRGAYSNFFSSFDLETALGLQMSTRKDFPEFSTLDLRIEERMSTNESDISCLQDDVSNVKSSVSELFDFGIRLDNLSDDISDLSATSESLEDKLESAIDEIYSIKRNVSRLDDYFTESDLEGRVDYLSEDMRCVRSEYENISCQLSSLDTRILNLEGTPKNKEQPQLSDMNKLESRIARLELLLSRIEAIFKD